MLFNLKIFSNFIFWKPSNVFYIFLQSTSTTTSSEISVGLSAGSQKSQPEIFDENADESVYLDELADLLDERSIAISAVPSLTSGQPGNNAQSDQVLTSSKTSSSSSGSLSSNSSFSNIPLNSVASALYGSKSAIMSSSSLSSSNSSILNTTLTRPLTQSSGSLAMKSSIGVSSATSGLQTPMIAQKSSPQLLPLHLPQTNSSIGSVKPQAGQQPPLVTVTNTSSSSLLSPSMSSSSPRMMTNLQNIQTLKISNQTSMNPNVVSPNSRIPPTANGGSESTTSPPATSPQSNNQQRPLNSYQNTNEVKMRQVRI